MIDHPSTNKSFVKADNMATIVCPECKTAKTIGVAQFRHVKHAVKAKCRCGHSFHVQLEFRRHFRKKTELDGMYDINPPAVGGGKTKIVNLSLNGVCFEVRGIHNLKVGQTGSLVFTLDNKKETVLVKNVIIKSIRDNKIGCEFVDDRAYEKELGFYMLP